MECKMGGEPGTVDMERNGNERNRERTGTEKDKEEKEAQIERE